MTMSRDSIPVLVGIDLETAGFNGPLENKDGTFRTDDNGRIIQGQEVYPILEITALVVSKHHRGFSHAHRTYCIKHDNFNEMEIDDNAFEMHAQSGLLAEIERNGIDMKRAEQEVVKWLYAKASDLLDRQITKENIKEANLIFVLFGNTTRFDMDFLAAQMPTLYSMLYYRSIDNSAFDMTIQYFHPNRIRYFKKTYGHRSGSDIIESYRELMLNTGLMMSGALFTNETVRLGEEIKTKRLKSLVNSLYNGNDIIKWVEDNSPKGNWLSRLLFKYWRW